MTLHDIRESTTRRASRSRRVTCAGGATVSRVGACRGCRRVGVSAERGRCELGLAREPQRWFRAGRCGGLTTAAGQGQILTGVLEIAVAGSVGARVRLGSAGAQLSEMRLRSEGDNSPL